MTSFSKGFTLIELVVVTGIIALISSLVLANNSRFGGVVLLQNLAYDIALSIRQAQQFGISVQSFQGNFGAAYGMHFQLSPATGNTVYVLFADAVDRNGLYDTGEFVQSTTVSQGYRIADLCVTPPSSAEVCGLTSIDITFQRPEPDAYIRSALVSGLNESARIRVSSPRGDVKEITIEANGQIAVH
jgi:prepilin-type N-terminal cleavage/methylation domain-containing protein